MYKSYAFHLLQNYKGQTTVPKLGQDQGGQYQVGQGQEGQDQGGQGRGSQGRSQGQEYQVEKADGRSQKRQ